MQAVIIVGSPERQLDLCMGRQCASAAAAAATTTTTTSVAQWCSG